MEQITMLQTAIDSHKEDYLSGKYTFLQFTNENEKTYSQGFLRGVDYAASLLKLQGKETPQNNPQPPTLERQDVKIVLDEENASTLHY